MRGKGAETKEGRVGKWDTMQSKPCHPPRCTSRCNMRTAAVHRPTEKEARKKRKIKEKKHLMISVILPNVLDGEQENDEKV